jgi:hypothetical protein
VKDVYAMKKLLGLKGNAYSLSRFLYESIKSNISSGCILVLPESYKKSKGINCNCFFHTSKYYYKNQTFGANSLCITVKDLKEAEIIFDDLGCTIGIIKDLDNQELFIIEKI